MKTKIVKAQTIFGKDREYKFNLMDCETGLKLWQDHFYALAMSAVEVQNVAIDKDGNVVVIDLLSTLTKVLPWDDVKMFASKLLSKCEINDGKNVHVADEDGLGDWASGDPLELYTALYHAAQANYEPLIKQLAPVEVEKKKKVTK